MTIRYGERGKSARRPRRRSSIALANWAGVAILVEIHTTAPPILDARPGTAGMQRECLEYRVRSGPVKHTNAMMQESP